MDGAGGFRPAERCHESAAAASRASPAVRPSWPSRIAIRRGC